MKSFVVDEFIFHTDLSVPSVMVLSDSRACFLTNDNILLKQKTVSKFIFPYTPNWETLSQLRASSYTVGGFSCNFAWSRVRLYKFTGPSTPMTLSHKRECILYEQCTYTVGKRPYITVVSRKFHTVKVTVKNTRVIFRLNLKTDRNVHGKQSIPFWVLFMYC